MYEGLISVKQFAFVYMVILNLQVQYTASSCAKVYTVHQRVWVKSTFNVYIANLPEQIKFVSR